MFIPYDICQYLFLYSPDILGVREVLVIAFYSIIGGLNQLLYDGLTVGNAPGFALGDSLGETNIDFQNRSVKTNYDIIIHL